MRFPSVSVPQQPYSMLFLLVSRWAAAMYKQQAAVTSEPSQLITKRQQTQIRVQMQHCQVEWVDKKGPATCCTYALLQSKAKRQR